MKLLIVTQTVDRNDANLGFFHEWLTVFARNMDLVVIANKVGSYNLPDNVEVYSMGKEQGRGRFAKVRMYRTLLKKLLPGVDGVFFHMAPEYVLAAGLLPKRYNKKTILWYTHKHVSLRLCLAEKMVDTVFSASARSFRLDSDKLVVPGHGIDTELFSPKPSLQQEGPLTLLTAGRISQTKQIDVLVEVLAVLRGSGVDVHLRIAGVPITPEDKRYYKELKQTIATRGLSGHVSFVGSLAYSEMPAFYHSGDIFINLSNTGSLDKAVLEAMAIQVKPLTANEAYADILPEKNRTTKDVSTIAQKVQQLAEQPADPALREYVQRNHSLKALAETIRSYYA